jgi:raffinose/stachyose/melibiose transport system permease protein
VSKSRQLRHTNEDKEVIVTTATSGVERTARGVKAPKSRLASTGLYWPWALPGLIAFTIVVVVAFLWNVYLSFTSWKQGLGTPKWIGLDNYIKLFQDDTFWQSFLHSVVFIVSMAVVPTGLGLIIASALFDYIAPRFGNGSSAAVRAAFFLPQIIPIAVAGLLWSWMLSSQQGTFNVTMVQWGWFPSVDQAPNWLGNAGLAMLSVNVVLIWIQIGYTVTIFMSGLARADQSVHEAAAIDGASWFQRFRMITINQLAPEISVVLLTTTVAALKVFAPVYVMTQGGPGTATNVPAYFSYFNFIQTGKVGYGAAIATVLAILLIVLALFLLRMQTKQGENR